MILFTKINLLSKVWYQKHLLKKHRLQNFTPSPYFGKNSFPIVFATAVAVLDS